MFHNPVKSRRTPAAPVPSPQKMRLYRLADLQCAISCTTVGCPRHDRHRDPRRHQNASARIRPSTIVTLDVPEGSIYGFIGPNGSGKTTTIRMIMNIILPDRGRHHGARQADVAPPLATRSATSPRSAASTRRCRCGGCCATTASSRAARSPSSIRSSTTGSSRLQLAEWADKRIDQLSKGMAQKVQFISAIVSQAAAADSRRAVLRPRSGQRRVAARRGASSCAARGRRSCSRRTTWRPPRGCAIASS